MLSSTTTSISISPNSSSPCSSSSSMMMISTNNFHPRLGINPSSSSSSSSCYSPSSCLIVRHGRGLRFMNPDMGFKAIRAFFDSSSSSSGGAAAASSVVAAATAMEAEAVTSEEDEHKSNESKIGSRVRVKVPLKVYHVPKVPEVDLEGMEGSIKQYVGLWKGKNISANLPFKVEFFKEIEGRGLVKILAHLKEDEFEYIDGDDKN